MDIQKKKLRGYLALSVLLILCLFFASAISFFLPHSIVDGAVISDVTKINTDLLLSTRDTTVGGNVFNADALSELYKELGGSSSASFSTVSTKAHTLKSSTYSDSSVKSIHSGMSSEDIRNESLNKKNIVVTLGGKEWIVVALTTKDQTSTSDVVLTLMLKDVEYTTAWARGTENKDFSVNYPITMYSSSYIRASLLNGKDSDGNNVYYSTDRTNNNTAFTAPSGHYPNNQYPFSIFSDTSAQGSITNFIVKPNEVLYQQYENRYDSVIRPSGATGSLYNTVNDSAKNKISASKWNPDVGTVAVESKTGYFDWGNDFIWLPSIAETGGYTSATTDMSIVGNANGLWYLDSNQRGASSGKATWLRSGAGGSVINMMTLNADGIFLITQGVTATMNTTVSGVATGTLGVRPCLNLNLTDAESSSATPISAPNSFSNEYNGSAQKITSALATWYTAEYANVVNVKYYDTSTEPKTELSNGPTDVGSYEVEFSFKDNKHCWSDNASESPRSVIFNITPKQVDFPKFLNDKNTDEYAGGTEITFMLTGFDSSYMDLFVSADNGSAVTLDKLRGQIKVTNVDKYTVNVTLSDTKNYEWKSTALLECEVEQAEIEVDITSASGGYILSGVQGGNVTANLIVSNGKGVKGESPVTIYVTANYAGLSPEDISSINLKNDSSDRHQITLNLTNLIKDMTYTLDVRSSDPNYRAVIKNTDTKLQVLDPSTRTKITWNLYEDGEKVFDKFADAELTEYSVSLQEHLTYNGKAYTFDVSLPSDCELDPSYGYKVEAKTASNNALGINADTYTTSIMLQNGQVYSIEWTIDPAKFDLSNVKWLFADGLMPFSPNGVSEELDTNTVPAQLQVSYSGNRRGVAVGDKGIVTVSFDLSSEDAQNYIKPVSTNRDSYEFTADGSNTDFEWQKSWEVISCVIPVEWIDVIKQDVNGKDYTVKVLKGDYDDIVEYWYYETNGAGEILDEQNPVDSLVVVDKVVKFYKAKAVIRSMWGNNYVLESDDYSEYFSVGESEVAVEVTLENTQLAYNGNAQEVKIKIVSGFTLMSNFQIAYYDRGGITPLPNAPANVGKYEAWISLKDGVSGFYLDGVNVEDGVAKVEYEIIQKQVDNSEWKTTYNPPSLNLQNKDDLNWIDYEYQDIEGNSLEFSDLQPGNTYKVRAVIKDKHNSAFSDGTTETEWKEFTIGANETLYDPTDPNTPDEPNTPVDPSEPTDPTTPEDPDDNGDFDKVLETLKDWWQVIVSGVSIVFILLFMSKTLVYESKRRKAKKETNEKYATFYAVSGIGLFGVSMSNWTIIACCLAGVAVLSLVFMIIAKSRCNKAVNELVKSKEEFDRRSREEELKRMFMMLGGNVNMNGAMGQQGYAYAGQGLGAEEIRGIVSETMTAMLPNVQQYLPQQASTNDELVQKLIEQNEHNEQMIEKLMAKLAEQPQKREFVDDEIIEKLAKKLAEQQPVDIINEREFATSGQITEKIIQVDKNDDIIQKLVEGQEKIMQILSEQPNEKVVEKIVEVPVEVEKVVEKEVRVEVPVEKIVEKEVIKEVPIEVEKVVEKIVEIPAEHVVAVSVEKPASKAKTVAPRLTLDEAYEKLSAKQKKIFDTLKAYAMSKDKCKEKKSTYFIVLGQSSVNPLIKLTIKKDTTVALFKMEDEFMKDIRRNATNDGTKVKVKETELIVGDMQALATAKEMVDLREDQIERYNEYLREQRSMKK